LAANVIAAVFLAHWTLAANAFKAPVAIGTSVAASAAVGGVFDQIPTTAVAAGDARGVGAILVALVYAAAIDAVLYWGAAIATTTAVFAVIVGGLAAILAALELRMLKAATAHAVKACCPVGAARGNLFPGENVRNAELTRIFPVALVANELAVLLLAEIVWI
jgi:hypothetical protein